MIVERWRILHHMGISGSKAASHDSDVTFEYSKALGNYAKLLQASEDARFIQKDAILKMADRVEKLNQLLHQREHEGAAKFALQRRYVNEFLAASVSEACSAIHASIKEICCDKDEHYLGAYIGNTLDKLLAECMYVLKVANLAASDKNPCREWESSAMHKIIDAACFNVVYTHRIFKQQLRELAQKFDLLGIAFNIGAAVEELSEVVRNKEDKECYRNRISLLNTGLCNAMRRLHETGKEQVLTVDYMDIGPIEAELRELVGAIAQRVEAGWKVDVQVTSSSHAKDSQADAVIHIKNLQAPAAAPAEQAKKRRRQSQKNKLQTIEEEGGEAISTGGMYVCCRCCRLYCRA